MRSRGAAQKRPGRLSDGRRFACSFLTGLGQGLMGLADVARDPPAGGCPGLGEGMALPEGHPCYGSHHAAQHGGSLGGCIVVFGKSAD